MRKRRNTGFLLSNLRASTADGAAFSVMVGMGETYLPAFILAVGLGEVLAGLAATLPMLVGAILQLASPHLIPLVGSHRRWVILCALGQAASFVPLILAAATGRLAWFVALAIATLYWGAGMATSPAWNTWMARAVPRSLRTRFFARRTRIAQVAVLTGLLLGGGILQLASSYGVALIGFAVIFGAAFSARLASAGFLAYQHEPRSPVTVEHRVPLVSFARRLRRREGGLLAYMLAAQTTTYLAAPYFNPFLLSKLQLHYSMYMMMLAAAFVAKASALPQVGRFTQRFGAKPLLWIGGLGIVPLPGLWLLSRATTYLLVLQVFGGVMWACYEFATFLLLFETIRDEERTSVLTSFNLLNATAIAVGSLIGGCLLRMWGESYQAYMIVFLASSLGRVLTLPLLHKVVAVPPVPSEMALRPLAVRPSAGSMDRPIVATLPGGSRHADNGNLPYRAPGRDVGR